jgi:hypothetical protein
LIAIRAVFSTLWSGINFSFLKPRRHALPIFQGTCDHSIGTGAENSLFLPSNGIAARVSVRQNVVSYNSFPPYCSNSFIGFGTCFSQNNINFNIVAKASCRNLPEIPYGGRMEYSQPVTASEKWGKFIIDFSLISHFLNNTVQSFYSFALSRMNHKQIMIVPPLIRHPIAA